MSESFENCLLEKSLGGREKVGDVRIWIGGDEAGKVGREEKVNSGNGEAGDAAEKNRRRGRERGGEMEMKRMMDMG